MRDRVKMLIPPGRDAGRLVASPTIIFRAYFPRVQAGVGRGLTRDRSSRQALGKPACLWTDRWYVLSQRARRRLAGLSLVTIW